MNPRDVARTSSRGMKMKAKIVMAATLAVALTAAAAGAQGRGAPPRGGPAAAGGGPGGGGRAEAMIQRQLFRGITLSDTERAQLRKLRTDDRTQMQALAQSERADRQALRTAFVNGDTVALKAARRKLDGSGNRRIALRGQLERNVRGLLTPDQRKQFDANLKRVGRRVGYAAHRVMRRRAVARRGRGLAPGRMRFAPGRDFGSGRAYRGGFAPGWGARGQGSGYAPSQRFRRGGFGLGGPGGRGAPGPDGGRRFRRGFGPGRGNGAAPPDSTRAPVGGDGMA
jgi:Spy/CpxP family protein refolding chaperone